MAKLSGSKALRKQHDKGSVFIGLQTGGGKSLKQLHDSCTVDKKNQPTTTTIKKGGKGKQGRK